MTIVFHPSPDGSLFQPRPHDRTAVGSYLLTKQPSAHRAITLSLHRVATMLGATTDQIAWSALTPDILTGIVYALVNHAYDKDDPSKRYAPATVNHCIAVVRGVVKHLWLNRVISYDQYQRLLAVKEVRGSRLPAGRDLTDGEVATLLQSCGNSAGGVRDKVIIAIFLMGGLRLHEMVSLDLDDYDPTRGQITVIGKGNKERVVCIDDETGATQRAMTAWLTIRGLQSGPLFCPVNKGGRVTIKRLTSQAVYNMLQTRGEGAGLPPFSPHDFRRTCIGRMLSDPETDIVTIAKHVGHANVNTTARYDRRSDTLVKQAVKRLTVPGLDV